MLTQPEAATGRHWGSLRLSCKADWLNIGGNWMFWVPQVPGQCLSCLLQYDSLGSTDNSSAPGIQNQFTPPKVTENNVKRKCWKISASVRREKSWLFESRWLFVKVLSKGHLDSALLFPCRYYQACWDFPALSLLVSIAESAVICFYTSNDIFSLEITWKPKIPIFILSVLQRLQFYCDENDSSPLLKLPSRPVSCIKAAMESQTIKSSGGQVSTR